MVPEIEINRNIYRNSKFIGIEMKIEIEVWDQESGIRNQELGIRYGDEGIGNME